MAEQIKSSLERLNVNDEEKSQVLSILYERVEADHIKKLCFISRVQGSVQTQATFQVYDIKPFPGFLET